MKIKTNLILLALAAFFLTGCTVDPDPGSLSFGEVYVGMTKVLTAVWTNNGNKNAQVLGASTQPPYSLAGSVTGALAPGQSTANVQITFAPAATGPFPEEARVATTGVNATKLQMTGQGVWAINKGNFVLENQPPIIVGSFDFSTTPIQPNQPIDWGTRRLGGPDIPADFQVRNTGTTAVNGTANLRLLKGNQHFTITFPNATSGMNIGPAGPPTLGTRRIQVTFSPQALGEWSDVVEITDSAVPANRAGIVLKAKVTETGE